MSPAALTSPRSEADLLVEVPSLPSPSSILKGAGDDRTKPHPSQAAAAPPRAAFKAQGAAIATGHPVLQGVQVRTRRAGWPVGVDLARYGTWSTTPAAASAASASA